VRPKVIKAGLDLIKKMENDNDPKAGYRVSPTGEIYFVPYICPAGHVTIGYGTIIYESGIRVSMNDKPISLKRAEELLHYEIREKADAVELFCTKNHVKLNDNKFSALVSLAYNCGVGSIINMDASMRSALIENNSEKIKAAFRMWNKVTVKVLGVKVKKALSGLTWRREKEIELFFKSIG